MIVLFRMRLFGGAVVEFLLAFCRLGLLFCTLLSVSMCSFASAALSVFLVCCLLCCFRSSATLSAVVLWKAGLRLCCAVCARFAEVLSDEGARLEILRSSKVSCAVSC